MNYNPTNCHNFQSAEKLGRCPLIAVCEDNCVYVWKNLYDSNSIKDYDLEIENLQDRIDELESEVNNYEEELNDANNEASDWEEKYNDIISDLSKVMTDESIEKLSEYLKDHELGSWASTVIEEREIRNACRIDR